jgi:hypothetical protein
MLIIILLRCQIIVAGIQIIVKDQHKDYVLRVRLVIGEISVCHVIKFAGVF